MPHDTDAARKLADKIAPRVHFFGAYLLTDSDLEAIAITLRELADEVDRLRLIVESENPHGGRKDGVSYGD